MTALDVIRIPVPNASSVEMRYSSLPRSGDFQPETWQHKPLDSTGDGWYHCDLSTLGLADGAYEYEFVVNRPNQNPLIVADPYAEEITRFGGYRGILRIHNGHRIRLPFNWQDELPNGTILPNNNELVIYELPMRWVDAPPDASDRQVGLGTFDKAIFERLEYFRSLGINAIELLPIQDSPDTLNWGYGTRFFFAPDLDMGDAFDLKLFIKRCHQKGIRVILDIVMNHSRGCSLEDLAFDWFYLKDGNEEKDPNGDPRPSWGGKIFRYVEKVNGEHLSRQFHCQMARYWIRKYHIDGFRIDEFKGINNWDFIKEFTRNAHAVQNQTLPGRPFTVIAEDSWRRPESTYPDQNGQPTVDATWDFDFRDTLRNLVRNGLSTKFGEPSRTDLTKAMLMGRWPNKKPFTDMAQRVIYLTSHDVEGYQEQRLLPYLLNERMLKEDLLKATDVQASSWIERFLPVAETVLEQFHSAFALTLTAVGMPMFLAGEEFADLHDIDHSDWRLKMSDPVNWNRLEQRVHQDALARIRPLIQLRNTHPALHRNEIEFFSLKDGFHPSFDTNNGERVFVYCRTAGKPLGQSGQIVVVSNLGNVDYPVFKINWHWGANQVVAEYGGCSQPLPHIDGTFAELELQPFQTRVFSIS